MKHKLITIKNSIAVLALGGVHGPVSPRFVDIQKIWSILCQNGQVDLYEVMLNDNGSIISEVKIDTSNFDKDNSELLEANRTDKKQNDSKEPDSIPAGGSGEQQTDEKITESSGEQQPPTTGGGGGATNKNSSKPNINK